MGTVVNNTHRSLMFVALALAAVFVLGCDSAQPSADSETATPSAPAQKTPSDPPGTEPTMPRAADADRYAYRPQLAYLDADGTAWLIDADGTGRVKLIEGCTGIGSTKRGDVLNGGLVWSPEGGRIACWRDDFSVLVANADGADRAMPFKAGECGAAPRWAAGGNLIACEVKGYVAVRSPDGRARVDVKNDQRDEWAWSPAGDALLVAVPPRTNRLAWSVVDLHGQTLAEIDDAFVSRAANFRWTNDGTRIVYPGDSGITVVDVQTGQRHVFQPPAESALNLRGGAGIDWILGDSAVLAHNYTGAAAIDVGSGDVKALPQTSYGVARVAPDGLHVVVAVPDGPDEPDRQHVAIVDLQTGTVSAIAGSWFSVEGIGLAAEFVFAGDTSRVCWTPRPANVPRVDCAELARAAEQVHAPVQVEPDVLGRGDPAVLWRAFSPDLTTLAYGAPGLESPGARQSLRVANRDGTVVADLGPMLGALTYSWRPARD